MFDLSGVSSCGAPRTGFLNDVLESMSEYEAGSVVRALGRLLGVRHGRIRFRGRDVRWDGDAGGCVGVGVGGDIGDV